MNTFLDVSKLMLLLTGVSVQSRKNGFENIKAINYFISLEFISLPSLKYSRNVCIVHKRGTVEHVRCMHLACGQV